MFETYYKQYSTAFIQTIQALDFKMIEQMMKQLEQARQHQQRVFVVGNGGSAASASHWAVDFGKGVNVEGDMKRFRITSLTDNVPWISALGNDISYDDIFVEQLKNLLREDDLLIGLSVSGDSENVVRSFQYAREQGARVLAIVGKKEGRMKELADLALVVPSEDYGIVEDIHMFVNHVISQYLRTVYEGEKD